MTEERIRELELFLANRGFSGQTQDIIKVGRRYKLCEVDAFAALDYIEQNRGNNFTALLFDFIDKTGKKDSDIYKKAGIDRRLFSKIRSTKNYTPAKKTVVALCLALELSRADADRLLQSAGYSLSRADDYDLIIAFCIEKRIFDFDDINEALYRFGFEVF